MTRRIFPYPVVVGDVSLEVAQVRLDDIALPYEMISTSERMVALHRIDRRDWRSARLSVQVRAPERELEGPWSGISCMALLAERRTNTRTAVRLRRERPGQWAGEVELHRDRHLAQAELTGQLIADVDGVAGRMIATTTDSWTIDLRARTPSRRDEIKTRWIDFAADANPHLHAFRSDPWLVEAVGEEPVLYLNSGFDGLKSLLESGRPADRAVRDNLASQIAMGVWTAMFNAALYLDEMTSSPQWPGGWRESVLRRMLPDIFPEFSPEDALTEVLARRRSGEGGGDLQTRIMHAASRRAQVAPSLGALIRTLSRTSQEDE
ncbi:hypothetical protein J5X84_08965 [Streptosporangiaceae bacterium NEAU-GS5]|nr:hypothetical protein [Streptosporangiaceae bacterium NEAU-GS5]